MSKIGSNTDSYIGSSIIGYSAGSVRSSIGSSIRIAKGYYSLCYSYIWKKLHLPK